MTLSRKELFFVIIISFIAVVLSAFQTWEYLASAPKSHVYPLVHNYPQDYYYYLSYIKQGTEGKLLITSRFSPEERPYLFIYTFFPLTGMIGRIFSDRPDVIYTAARIFWGTVLLAVSYIFAGRIFRSFGWRLMFLAVTIFHAPMWRIAGGRVYQEGEFWTGFDPVMKLSFLPHHLASLAVAILSVYLFILSLEKNRRVLAAAAGLLFLCASLMNTAVFLACFPAVIFLFIQNIRTERKKITQYLIFLVFPLPGLALLSEIMKNQFPWNIFAGWEKSAVYPIDMIMLAKSLGVTLLFFAAAIPFVIKLKNRIITFSLGMVLSPFILVSFMTGKLPVSNIRFVQSGQYIFAAILSVLAVSEIYSRIKKRHFRYLFLSLTVLLFGIQYIPSVYSSILRQMDYIKGNKYNGLIYAPASYLSLLDKLDETGKDDEVVLCDPSLCPLVPAFTNKKVVYGHPILTESPDGKVNDTLRYYADPQSRREIENRYRIKYVIARSDDASFPAGKVLFPAGDLKIVETDI